MTNEKNTIETQVAVWQRDTKYEGELPEKFFGWADRALHYASAYSLRTSVEDYKKMRLAQPGEHSIIDINTMFFVIKMRSQKEMEMDATEYLEMHDQIEESALKLLTMVHKKNAELQSAAMQAKNSKNKKSMKFPAAVKN